MYLIVVNCSEDILGQKTVVIGEHNVTVKVRNYC